MSSDSHSNNFFFVDQKQNKNPQTPWPLCWVTLRLVDLSQRSGRYTRVGAFGAWKSQLFTGFPWRGGDEAESQGPVQ